MRPTLQDFERWVRNGHPIGQGATRWVYDLGDHVAKMPLYTTDPKTKSRSEQSEKELEVFQNCPDEFLYLICPIVDHYYVSDTLIVIMPKMKIIGKEEKKELRGHQVGKEMRLETYYRVKGIDASKILEDTDKLCKMFNLQRKEVLNNTANWGLNGSQVKYIDYGYTGA